MSRKNEVRIGVRISKSKVAQLCTTEGITFSELGERLNKAGLLSQSGLYKVLNDGVMGSNSISALSTYFGFDSPAKVAAGLLEVFLPNALEEEPSKKDSILA